MAGNYLGASPEAANALLEMLANSGIGQALTTTTDPSTITSAFLAKKMGENSSAGGFPAPLDVGTTGKRSLVGKALDNAHWPYEDQARGIEPPTPQKPAVPDTTQQWRAGERAAYEDPAIKALVPKKKATPTSSAAQSTSGPAPTATDATPMQQSRFNELKTSPISTPYDDQAAMMHDIYVMLGSLGDYEGAMQAQQSFMQAHGQRNKAQAEMALNALTAGNIEPAIAVMNHTVPNGRQIVGYSADSDGKKFTMRYSDGTNEDMTREGIGQAMIGMRDPEVWGSILKSREAKRAELGNQIQLKSYEAGLDANKAILANTLGIARDRLKTMDEQQSKLFLAQYGIGITDPSARVTPNPLNPEEYFVSVGNQVYKTSKDANGNTAMVEVRLPGAAASKSVRAGAALAAPQPTANAGTIAGVPTRAPGIF